MPVQVVDKTYQGVAVDTRYTPIRNILQYVEGARYQVRYYSQALARDTELSAQQVGLTPTEQGYIVIDKLLLAVSQELTPTQDEENKSWTVTGSAVVYGGIKPNLGDMFLGDIGDGREGIFTVTRAEAMTHLKDTLYEIDYQIVGESSTVSRRRADLDAKVVQEFIFVRDYLAVGEKPIITKAEFTQRQDMLQARSELISQYFADFYSYERSTLIIPDQTGYCYDPFLAGFVGDVVSTRENFLVNKIDMPMVLALPGMRQFTVWDTIRQNSGAMVRSVSSRVGLLTSKHFISQPHYAGAYYAGLDMVAYPLDKRTDPDTPFDRCVPATSGAIVAGDVRRGSLSEYLQPVQGFQYSAASQEAMLPYIVAVTHDNRYVFTEAFYNCEGPFSSQLERQVHAMLNELPLDKGLVLDMAKQANRWPNLERFYYVPMLLALLNKSVRTN